MGVGVGLYMCDVVKKFTFVISSPDEFWFYITCNFSCHKSIAALYHISLITNIVIINVALCLGHCVLIMTVKRMYLTAGIFMPYAVT